MSEQLTEVVTKNWKSVGVFNSYEEALDKKTLIAPNHTLVKIKRCGNGGEEFRVKVWDEKAPKKAKKKKK